VLRLDADQIGIVVTERVIGFEHDTAAFANLLLRERLFDLRENALMSTMKIGDRGARFLDKVSSGRVKAIGKRHDGVGKDVHGDPKEKSGRWRTERKVAHGNPPPLGKRPRVTLFYSPVENAAAQP